MAAIKGGKAEAELRRRREEGKLRYPLNLPLFTSPLEAGPSATRKVSAEDKGNTVWRK